MAKKIVAKALDGQRYPLPLCEYTWVCEGERGSGHKGANDQIQGLRGQISGLRGQILGLRGQILGLRGQISGLRGPWGDTWTDERTNKSASVFYRTSSPSGLLSKKPEEKTV